MEQSEIVLVHTAQSGNVDSFNAIVLKYKDVMFRTTRRILEQDDFAISNINLPVHLIEFPDHLFDEG